MLVKKINNKQTNIYK